MFPCMESLLNIISSIRWMAKLNFSEDKQILHMILARYLSDLLIFHDACINSRHLPGLNNTIAYSFSRYFHLTHADWTLYFSPSTLQKNRYPDPENFPDACHPILADDLAGAKVNHSKGLGSDAKSKHDFWWHCLMLYIKSVVCTYSFIQRVSWYHLGRLIVAYLHTLFHCGCLCSNVIKVRGLWEAINYISTICTKS